MSDTVDPFPVHPLFPHVVGKPILDVPKPIPAPVNKAGLLDRALRAVAGRGDDYGPPDENFARIARRWRAHLMNRFGVDVALDGVSVAIMCDDIKTARLENDPKHLDSWVDKAGYAACGAEIAMKS